MEGELERTQCPLIRVDISGEGGPHRLSIRGSRGSRGGYGKDRVCRGWWGVGRRPVNRGLRSHHP